MVQNYISKLMPDFPIFCKTLYLNLTLHHNIPKLSNINFYSCQYLSKRNLPYILLSASRPISNIPFTEESLTYQEEMVISSIEFP